MNYHGRLDKMDTEYDSPIQYFIVFESSYIHVNQLLDQEISFTFAGYKCGGCGLDKKIFRQGFCYDCFNELPAAGEWIMNPEKSTAHLDIEDRNLEYEKKVQLKPHIVYLANSSNVKVGVTRKTQVPTRWIDQGAHEALPILETPNRYLAGIAEVALKDYVADKTNWRKMLKNEIEDINLIKQRDLIIGQLPEECKPYILNETEETHIEFPVLQYPEKLKSLSIEKARSYKGKLKGIKGQYLIFEDNTVMNVRNQAGMVVDIVV